ncbi:unnamed protein product [Penicillium salamii]|nr:unnamed protein product [Penicillium salamii]
MARAEVEYSRESVLPVFKNRLTGETGSLQRPYKARPSIESRRTASYNIFPPQNLNGSQEFPFPDVSDNARSPVDRRNRGSMASSFANDTPMEQPWVSESHQLMDAPENNISSDGLDYRTHKSKSVKPRVHIKPILRKMSRDDAPSTSIDLSRSSTEQEGLGIYMNFERERGGSVTGVTYKRTPTGLHNRSTSGTSQFSNGSGSSGGKPGSQYVHPMRQTPRAYTPPLGQSYQDSNESDDLDESPESEPADLPESYSSSQAPPRLSLQIQDDSLTRLPSISQTNVTSRPSFSYSRDMDSTTSPMSRNSLDFVFRSRTRTSTDPISRAATVQAARQAFEDKEAEKSLRLEKQQIKAEERGSRRRLKRHTSSNAPESPVMQSSEDISEKPRRSTIHESEEHSASWKSQSKSTWVLFMTWLRTRIFKLKRKIRKH